ncbi:MAG: Peptidase Ste24p [Chlorobi bacterium]|nr:Peptidase Ste24p [Chlorobiota bacterium]
MYNTMSSPVRSIAWKGEIMKGGRFLIAIVVAVMSIIGYFTSSVFNPVTQEKQHVGGVTPEQEIALGVQAAPQMAQQYGGEDPDTKAQALVDKVGGTIVSHTDAGKTPYSFDFHVLADDQTINAFALPGGQVFITDGLLKRLHTEGELAGVLGHEIGHVVARHGAEHMAKAQLTQGLTGAAVLATYDPNNPSTQRTAAVAALIGQMVDMKFGRADELEADKLGVRLMADAGYDPRAMIGVMKTLQEAGGGSKQPEFFSTHPNPDHRIEQIQSAISQRYPQGVPEGMNK